ncbi:ribonuclease III [Sphingosinicella rhizophila]|uniref:Ribonuclease 3 n=1 Tax=Sphingosinicella rhizophila TaxID=3050082 RepID=A0ABU3QBJ7_9SPHN|nr:ribonuclease III [Sphingosinicella sp. GR2756]MDT9600780.1 ribonuclease III [Sphingosinicella sp. GR2756]
MAATSTRGTNAAWVEATLGHKPKDPALFDRALTHSSRSDNHYERLEFLGDRVLGLVVATWLYELFPDEPEGKLSRRLNALVTGETCAEIARELGVGGQVILGKQARDDRAADSVNVLGDVVEAMIGALYLEAGLEAATAFIRRAWGERVSTRDHAPKHPKSALQEWAAAEDKRPPVYELKGRSGPHHAPRFLVEVAIRDVGSASAEGLSKQEAETAAAAKLLEQLT